MWPMWSQCHGKTTARWVSHHSDMSQLLTEARKNSILFAYRYRTVKKSGSGAKLDKPHDLGDKPWVMDFGVSFASAADHWRVAKRAEEPGFSHAWFSDSQLLNADVFVAMAAATMETSTIRLGSAVVMPSNRIAPVTANALASLNRLAPGRIDIGVSTGFTARRTMGLGSVGLAEMADYIDVVHGLLDRESVMGAGEGSERKVRFLNPELGLINTDDPIRLHVSAMGPKCRRLTARGMDE